jgi:hypothetical protein
MLKTNIEWIENKLKDTNFITILEIQKHFNTYEEMEEAFEAYSEENNKEYEFLQMGIVLFKEKKEDE